MQQDVEDLEEKIRNQDYLRADRRDWLEKRKMTKETAARGGRAGPRKIHK
jgi:hypothetical protein